MEVLSLAKSINCVPNFPSKPLSFDSIFKRSVRSLVLSPMLCMELIASAKRRIIPLKDSELWRLQATAVLRSPYQPWTFRFFIPFEIFTRLYNQELRSHWTPSV
jgi:hypothetical protein